MPKVKLHRCSNLWVKIESHPCWRVQHALNDAGIEYEIVKGPLLPKSRRTNVIRLSGQRQYPVIEFEDGTIYRAESKDMEATVRAGRLFEGRGGAEAAEAAPSEAPFQAPSSQ